MAASVAVSAIMQICRVGVR